MVDIILALKHLLSMQHNVPRCFDNVFPNLNIFEIGIGLKSYIYPLWSCLGSTLFVLDCIRATGSPHRLGHMSVVPSDAFVQTLEVVDNRTVLEVDISSKPE